MILLLCAHAGMAVSGLLLCCRSQTLKDPSQHGGGTVHDGTHGTGTAYNGLYGNHPASPAVPGSTHGGGTVHTGTVHGMYHTSLSLFLSLSQSSQAERHHGVWGQGLLCSTCTQPALGSQSVGVGFLLSLRKGALLFAELGRP